MNLLPAMPDECANDDAMKVTLYTKDDGPLEIQAETVRAMRHKWPTKDIPKELERMHLFTVMQYPLKDHGKCPKSGATAWQFVRNWMKKAPDVRIPQAPVLANWWRSEQGVLEAGARAGINARPGESLSDYKARIAAKLNEQAA